MPDKNEPATIVHRIAIGSVLLLLFLAAIGVQIAIWGNKLRTAGSEPERTELELLLLVVSAAAIGSFVHAATSFASYVGNEKFLISWGWWYMLRIPIGVGLGILLYSLVRGGLLAGSVEAKSISPFGMAAVSGMAGLFSKQAIDKLKETFDTLFQNREDAERKDKLDHQPKIASIEPASLPISQQDAKIRLIGKDLNGLTVFLDSHALTTTTLADGGLEATVPAELLAVSSSYRVFVQSPTGARTDTNLDLTVA